MCVIHNECLTIRYNAVVLLVCCVLSGIRVVPRIIRPLQI